MFQIDFKCFYVSLWHKSVCEGFVFLKPQKRQTQICLCWNNKTVKSDRKMMICTPLYVALFLSTGLISTIWSSTANLHNVMTTQTFKHLSCVLFSAGRHTPRLIVIPWFFRYGRE